MSVQSLAPTILIILTAPATDLSTVSAKQVRKQLLELRPDITIDFIKQNKKAIDRLIGTIFESLNNTTDGSACVQADLPPEPPRTNGKRKRESEIKEEEDDEEDNGEEGSGGYGDGDIASPPPPLKKTKKGASQKLTDEEYARQLSSELNQRPSRGNRKSNGSSKKGASRSPKKKKSKPEIEDSDEDDEDGGSRIRKPKKRSAGNGDAKGGFAKEFTLSDPLSVVVNAPQLSRPQVVKKLWEYIKSNELQNPLNKREIVCDDTLRAVFNVEKIDMFTMNKVLSG
ncbi:hypothetical protein BU17DRAFT_41035 [Hysterangium stoloniferum]|nr:hypothetical protein BU17DRAFT_41035 [Hysterangium stoloniferum]